MFRWLMRATDRDRRARPTETNVASIRGKMLADMAAIRDRVEQALDSARDTEARATERADRGLSELLDFIGKREGTAR